jgi:hypothetical protein
VELHGVTLVVRANIIGPFPGKWSIRVGGISGSLRLAIVERIPVGCLAVLAVSLSASVAAAGGALPNILRGARLEEQSRR